MFSLLAPFLFSWLAAVFYSVTAVIIASAVMEGREWRHQQELGTEFGRTPVQTPLAPRIVAAWLTLFGVRLFAWSLCVHDANYLFGTIWTLYPELGLFGFDVLKHPISLAGAGFASMMALVSLLVSYPLALAGDAIRGK